MKRPLWKTVAGLVLTAIMLFPVYWMINVSFTRDTDMRHDPPYLFPVHGTLEGGNNNQEWNSIMATAVVASLPAAVLLVVAQRYVAAGVTAGAVKD